MTTPRLAHALSLASTLALACTPAESPPIDGVTTTQGGSASTSSSSSSATATATSETGTEPTDPEPTDPEPTGPEPSTTAPTTFVPDVEDPWGDSCDVWQQDCPEGEKCVPYASTGGSWDSHKCVPLMGDQAPGEPCTYAGAVDATDDCDGTSMCWNVNAEGDGTCTLFCTGTPDDPMCPPGSSCLITGDSTLTLCISSCDPLIQDCDDGLACYWVGSDFQCVFTTQDIPPGDPCGFINDCETGSSCTAAEVLPACLGAACCAPFCDISAPGNVCDALPGTECVLFFVEGEAPPGQENVGLCLSP